MLLYHGTSGINFDQNIKEKGLIPRGKTLGTWACSNNLASNGNLVYITNNSISSNWYSMISAIEKQDTNCVILTIDTDKLDQHKFRVDENYLDELERGNSVRCPFDLRKKQRKNAQHDKRWLESLSLKGMCAYLGPITVDAIVDVNKFNITDNLLYRTELVNYDLDRDQRMCNVNDFLKKGIPFNTTYNKWSDQIG